MSPDRHARTMLPSRPATVRYDPYDSKDPDTAYPPIEPLVPPEGAPNVLIICWMMWFRRREHVWWSCRTPRRTAGRAGLMYNRFTTALCAPTRAGVAVGP